MISPLIRSSNHELVECVSGSGLTIHGLSLNDIVPVIFGEKEVEVSSGIHDLPDLILLIDEIAKTDECG